jgi:hypothetical protein
MGPKEKCAPMGKRDDKMVPEDDPQWTRFWNAYPRHVSKKDARKAWLAIGPTSADVDKMLKALEWQSPEWARDGYKFCPYPASWLRAARFDDEPLPQLPRQGSRLPSETGWSQVSDGAGFAQLAEYLKRKGKL